ncbi:hypothetical protein EDD73_11251 [Heliophilum fasciatum]|uniref:Uncharacterized protein n=1 Tax=Heliophilum fasciatum TaxID=35700 RepID=A0A4R2RJT1_9FIRM|nr:hypothetical protein [Heliophilum fasciatum]TCP64090.1 hypothetical protein EDD73_11251 [Heliophilum fasciatum]
MRIPAGISQLLQIYSTDRTNKPKDAPPPVDIRGIEARLLCSFR